MLLRVLLVAAVLLTSCSSTPEVVESANAEVGVEVPAPTLAPQPADRGPDEEPPESLPVTTAAVTVVAANPSMLDPETALIGGVTLVGERPQEWTYGHRPYGPIEAQTDCEPFNFFETRGEYEGVVRDQTLGNVSVQHAVFDAGPTADKLRDAAGRVAGDCPTMLWLEGGKASNEALMIGAWVGYRQQDPISDVVMWTYAASRENLLSVLVLTTWGEAEPVDDESLADLVALADRALSDATPPRSDRAEPAAPTTTTPGPATTSTVPIVSTVTTAPPVIALGPLERYLLDEDDLDRPVVFEEVPTIDAVEFERCDNASVFAAFFGQIEVAAISFEDDLNLTVMQMIGPLEWPEDTAAAMREIEELVTCALESDSESDVTFERLENLPPPAVDAAVISFDESSVRIHLLFIQFEDAVMYLGLGEDSGYTPTEMLQLVSAKAAE